MTTVDEFLEHHGVKGMKWGVRRQEKKAAKKVAKADKKWEKGLNKQYFEVYNQMADRMNSTEINRINNKPKYKGKDLSKPSKLQKDYYDEYAKTTTKVLNELATSVIGTNASGTLKAKFDYDPNTEFLPRMSIVAADVQHAATVNEIELEWSSTGFITSMKIPEDILHAITVLTVDEFLEHYGVKGMQWGVRKAPGVSGRVNRDAAKDAKEFARAKQFYGKGAGTRRKLIKAKVEEKSKRSGDYKKAFDHHLNSQDMSKHSDKAVAERKSKDRRERGKQRAGYVARRFTGEMGTQAAFLASAAAGAAYLNSPKGRALLNKTMSKVNDVGNSRAQKAGAQFLSDYFARNS